MVDGSADCSVFFCLLGSWSGPWLLADGLSCVDAPRSAGGSVDSSLFFPLGIFFGLPGFFLQMIACGLLSAVSSPAAALRLTFDVLLSVCVMLAAAS